MRWKSRVDTEALHGITFTKASSPQFVDVIRGSPGLFFRCGRVVNCAVVVSGIAVGFVYGTAVCPVVRPFRSD